MRKVTFPWPSATGALAAITGLLVVTDPVLASFYRVPAVLLRDEVRYLIPGVFALLLLVDLRLHAGQYAAQKADLLRLRRQVRDLWEGRRRLQLKAHTYSGHADRLKLFISDKLLDYIEYDEKFLHFKGIAAEVRHNGVISFDKVQTALRQAAASAAEARIPAADYHAALDAMRYLWDLLDLSTADNLALHIGNLLCECEEHHYQRLLNADETEPAPYEPTYPPQRAAWRALALVRPEPLAAPEPGEAFALDDARWHVRLAPVGPLLGKENHLVLLLENLLRNAQYFSAKRGYRSPFAPVALTLTEDAGHACLRVYNRGPHIRDEDMHSLFQLGFSTRRIREHHGRGLGLYFVDQIVKGYEGRIAVRNIHTAAARYTIRIELENDDVTTELVDVVVENGQPQCRAEGCALAAERAWTFASAVRSVEITATDGQDTRRLAGPTDQGRNDWFDPANPERPHWRVAYRPRRADCEVTFEPLDISGVEFEVRLPTARLRVENSELAEDVDFEGEVERLDERFRARVGAGGGG